MAETENPYSGLGRKAFWRSGVAEASPFNPEGIYTKKWEISPQWKIATAGSCFAQYIGRHLNANGFRVLDLEPPPDQLPREVHHRFGFSLYSARYGNIYTVQQLLQLAREVAGTFVPADIAWEKDGKFYDALRPAVEPEGLDSREELQVHREYHLRKVKEMFQTMDLLIFTLGLTEAWVHRKSGTVYPTSPGVIAGTYDERSHAFKNYTFFETMAAFDEFQNVIFSLRENNTTPKIVLTVSPVPLTATASGNHVLQATTYSKSVLRSVAGQLAADQNDIDYFPSYEIITNQAARGNFYGSNLRSVRSEGVATVMKVFFSEHSPAAPRKAEPDDSWQQQSQAPEQDDEEDTQCEEALLEAFGE